AVEEAVEPWPDRARCLRQRVCAFVCGAERTGATLVGEVLAKCLLGPAARALGDGLGELDLIFARHLMHVASCPVRILRLRARPRICSKLNGVHWRETCTL